MLYNATCPLDFAGQSGRVLQHERNVALLQESMNRLFKDTQEILGAYNSMVSEIGVMTI